MKRTAIPTLLLMLAICAAAPAATMPAALDVTGQLESSSRPDFSGTWSLDREASRITTAAGLAGLGGGGAPDNLYITQARNGALILSSRVNGAQPRAYRILGENAVPAPGDDGGRFVVRTRWSGETLVSEGSGRADGEMVQLREVMSLSSDRRTLTLEVTTTTGGNAETNHLIYEKGGTDD